MRIQYDFVYDLLFINIFVQEPHTHIHANEPMLLIEQYQTDALIMIIIVIINISILQYQ